MERVVVALPDAGRDHALAAAAGRDLVDTQQAAVRGCRDLAGIELVVGIEGGLDPLQAGIERAEEGRRVLGAHALAVLAPQHAAMLAGERHHFVGDLADQRGLGRIGHVDRWTHMEHAGIDVAEHAVDQPAAVERGSELRDIVGELLGGYGRVLDERDGAAAARHVAQEPYRLLAHAPDALHRPIREGGFRPMAVLLGFVAVLGDAGCAGDGLPLRPARISRHREATAAARPTLLLEERGHAFQLRREIVGVVGQQLDQVDSLGRALGIVGEELLHLVPDDVVAGEPQHPRVDGFDRGRLHGDQGARVAQGGIETVVADVHQRRVLRDRQYVELGFGDEAERALRPAQDGVEVEASVAVADMGEVVAGERAVELREALGDQRLVVADGWR